MRSWGWYFTNFISLPVLGALIWVVAKWTGFV